MYLWCVLHAHVTENFAHYFWWSQTDWTFFVGLVYINAYHFTALSKFSIRPKKKKNTCTERNHPIPNLTRFLDSRPDCPLLQIDAFHIRRATSVPLGKCTKFALHHGKMLTTKHRATEILHISTFQFTFKCGYNYFISKYTDINSLHVIQIDLLHNDTFYST